MEIKIVEVVSKKAPYNTYTNIVLVLDNGREIQIRPAFPQDYLTLSQVATKNK